MILHIKSYIRILRESSQVFFENIKIFRKCLNNFLLFKNFKSLKTFNFRTLLKKVFNKFKLKEILKFQQYYKILPKLTKYSKLYKK